MFKNTVFSFSLKVLSAVVGFCINYVLLDKLELVATDRLFFLMAIASIFRTVIDYGFNTLILRENIRSENAYKKNKLITYVHIWGICVCVTILSFMYFIIPIFNIEVSISVLLLLIVNTFFLVSINWMSSNLQSHDFTKTSAVFYECLYQVIVLILLLIVAVDLVGVLKIYLVSSVVVLFLVFLVSFKLKTYTAVVIRGNFNLGFINASTSFFIVVFISAISANINQIIIGLNELEEGALSAYSISLKLSISMSFILIIISKIISPKLSFYYKNKKFIELINLYKKSSLFTIIIALPLALIFLFGAEFILGFFGDSLAKYSDILKLMIFAQIANCVTGPLAALLNMVGYERHVRNVVVFFSLLSITASFFIIPLFGVYAAAWIFFISMVGQNVTLFYIYNKFGKVHLLGYMK